jgi:hypothetical protein
MEMSREREIPRRRRNDPGQVVVELLAEPQRHHLQAAKMKKRSEYSLWWRYDLRQIEGAHAKVRGDRYPPHLAARAGR